MEATQALQEWVRASNNIVFFGGAGMSTESGIPDFRSVDGLYSRSYSYPPEEILSSDFFRCRPLEFFRFYQDKLLCLGAKPNAGHLKLAALERAGKLRAVITQNIDGLHTAAGSQTVLELHGSVHRNTCIRCGKLYDARFIRDAAGIPHCACGAAVKPDVVLYGEALDENILSRARRFIREAEVLIVGGTSLAVYPASSLIDFYGGDKLVLINRTPTPADSRAALLLRDSIGQVLGALEG